VNEIGRNAEMWLRMNRIYTRKPEREVVTGVRKG
jgi:hypothetical protein